MVRGSQYDALLKPNVLVSFLSLAYNKERFSEFTQNWGPLSHSLFGIGFLNWIKSETTMIVEGDRVRYELPSLIYEFFKPTFKWAPLSRAVMVLDYSGFKYRIQLAKQQRLVERSDSDYVPPLKVFVGQHLEASQIEEFIVKIGKVELPVDGTISPENDFYLVAGESEAQVSSLAWLLLEAVETFQNMQESDSVRKRNLNAFLREITHLSHIEIPPLSEKPVWRVKNLLGAVCFHLLKVICDGNLNLQVCPYCKSVFTPVRRNQKFCSPTCRNRYSTQQAHQRKKSRRGEGDGD